MTTRTACLAGARPGAIQSPPVAGLAPAIWAIDEDEEEEWTAWDDVLHPPDDDPDSLPDDEPHPDDRDFWHDVEDSTQDATLGART